MRVKKRPHRWNGSNEPSNSHFMSETHGGPQVAEMSTERSTGSKEPSEWSHNSHHMLASGGSPSEDDEKSGDGSALSKGSPKQPPYKSNRMSTTADEKSADGAAGSKGCSKQLPYKSTRMSATPGPPGDRKPYRDEESSEEGGHDDDDHPSVAQGTSSLGAAAVHMEAKGQSSAQHRKRRREG